MVSDIDLAEAHKRERGLGGRLSLTREFLMQRDAAISESLYPNALSVGNNALPLQYAFDPAAADDGVSIDVPISLLNQVSSEKLDWLVPGLLPEKCLARIKSPPETLRNNFLPTPGFA